MNDRVKKHGARLFMIPLSFIVSSRNVYFNRMNFGGILVGGGGLDSRWAACLMGSAVGIENKRSFFCGVRRRLLLMAKKSPPHKREVTYFPRTIVLEGF
jgi:hypothetical protein